MRFRKYFFLLVLGMFVIAMSCQRVDLSPEDNSTQISIDDIPVPTVDYIDQTFAGLTILKVEKKFNNDGSFKKYEVYLSNGVKLDFDMDWNQIFDDSGNSGNNDDSFDIPYADLPQDVKDYMSQHYPDASIKRVKKKINDDGSARLYEIRLTDGTKIFFNGAGHFIGIDD